MTFRRTIDLNCDMGEILRSLSDGTDEQLMQIVTSVNIACGVHAGDEQTMRAIVRLAKKYNTGIGAHPGYPDRLNAGRVSMKLSEGNIREVVADQLRSLGRIAAEEGCEISHVKPHGALYNDAAKSRALAGSIAEGVLIWNKDVTLVGLAGSVMLAAWGEMGFQVRAEGFADRTYEADGTLRPRQFSDALITDPAAAADQALSIARRGRVVSASGSELEIAAETICIHGDTPGAVAIAKAIKTRLENSGILLAKLTTVSRK